MCLLSLVFQKHCINALSHVLDCPLFHTEVIKCSISRRGGINTRYIMLKHYWSHVQPDVLVRTRAEHEQ